MLQRVLLCRGVMLVVFLTVVPSVLAVPAAGQTPASQPAPPKVFERSNLVAWCIVPFDSKKRGPAERAEMLQRLGLRRVAYDWRAEHVPTFEQEILEYKKRGLEYFAFWSAHEEAFRLFEKHQLRPQIWQTLGSPQAETQDQRIAAAAAQMLPLVERTKKLGCRLGLYNHGGWGGEPENLIAVCRYLRQRHGAEHVGIVYNLHHGHGHLEDFAAVLRSLQPYLLCLNLNGMTTNGDQRGRKILPLGEGEHDVTLLKVIAQSGYKGPVGIIGHTQDDVEQRLRDNLDGLDWILPQLDGKPPGPKPELRTWSAVSAPAPPPGTVPGTILEGIPQRRQPPLTVACRAVLPDRNGYNILVASDTKKSGDHWELFSMNGSGLLTAYLPGFRPDHVHSQAMVCDGRPHQLGMILEANRVRLLVDGRVVADQDVQRTSQVGVPGALGIGRLVEGGLGCRGTLDWVCIMRGAVLLPETAEGPPFPADLVSQDAVLLEWRAPDRSTPQPGAPQPPADAGAGVPAEYSAETVARLVEEARSQGDSRRGVLAFSSARSACISCHQLHGTGGQVGPDLTTIARTRTAEEIVESILWPKRQVKPEFVAHRIVTADGRSRQGYLVSEDDHQLVLRDPAEPDSGALTIPLDEIEARREVGTLMPDNLVATMTASERNHLLRFLFGLGREDAVPAGEVRALLQHAVAHLHGPATFPLERRPLRPEDWPSWQEPVNRDRLYDFYAKQANHFRQQSPTPVLLAEFPGLDGGQLGHWGNQNEQTWASDRWNATRLGSVHCGVFRGAGVTVPRGVCVRLGEDGQLSVCFNPDTLTYDAVWTGGFVKFSSVRHGFLHGALMDGQLLQSDAVRQVAGQPPAEPFEYHGFHRVGANVVFAYRIGEQELLDWPRLEDGQFVRVVAPPDQHPLREALADPPGQWPQRLERPIELGANSPYAVDTLELPTDNPWNALCFCSGHDFLPDGSALVCTMQGDVWHVSGFDYPSRRATWRRFASGLNQPQGLVADEDGIFVLGRDQITRLHDRNADGEADFYECFSNAFQTSPAGHDFICGLERDQEGRFLTASGNQGLVRISADGKSAQVLATGFRNPDGLGLLPDGTVTVPCSEGSWTPASMICAVRPPHTQAAAPPHFGYGGPRNGEPPQLPLAYLPRGIDNSSGGQAVVQGDRWGPLDGQLLHFSFGAGSHFLVLRDEVQGQLQGAVVPLPGEFRSGVHRGRFREQDGQLYVTGMQGWGSYTPDPGCFQRVRYTGQDVQLPIGFRVHQNGVRLEFSSPLDPATAAVAANHFAQCWNYRYSGGYGSAEFSSRHPSLRGHDVLPVTSAHVLDDGQALFLEIPDLQPVNQLHLLVQSAPGRFHELFVTVHQLDQPLSGFPGYQPQVKVVRPHPILADLALATRSVPNPHRNQLDGARPILMETGTNLSFATRSFRVRAGEPIALKLVNPDVVPHNWALVRPGTLERVGRLANQLIADPEAALRHYVPASSDVLAYTDVVLPKEEFTIYFHAPRQPGRYPYLCTFPGHWLVMNGEMIVEAAR